MHALFFAIEPLIHHIPADDLLQAVNIMIQHDIRARIIFFLHIPIFPQIVHVGGLQTEAIITNTCMPLRYFLVSRLLWFCGFNGCVLSQICVVRYMRRLSFFAMLKFNGQPAFLLSLKACSKLHSTLMDTNTSAPIIITAERIALLTTEAYVDLMAVFDLSVSSDLYVRLVITLILVSVKPLKICSIHR